MADLSRLLAPKTVALIGGFWARVVKFQLERQGFAGSIWHVNPKSEFKSVADLPGSPDAAFVAVNRHAAVDIVQALSEKKTGGAICFSSGFEEAGEEGAKLQTSLLRAAGKMPLLGPNCYGVINYLDGVALWPDVHGGKAIEVGIALVTQSSNILINMTMQQRGVPVAYVIAAGNGAQVGLPDLIAAMDADPRVTAIGLHIEGFGDPVAFHAAARNCSKPIVALKAGETKAAQALTISHTASLSGSDRVASAFLERCGIGRVFSLEGLMEALKVLHVGGEVADKSLASVSCSGGEATLMADTGARFGFDFPAIDDLGINKTLNPLVHVSNPFDYHTFDWGNSDALTPAFTKVLQGPQAFTIFVLDWPRSGSGDLTGFEIAVTCITSAQSKTGSRAGILATYPENMPEHLALHLMSAGIVPFHGMQAGLEGLAAAVLPSGGDFTYISKPSNRKTVLTEFQGKQDLASAGVIVPSGKLITSHDEVPKTTEHPMVMKAVSRDLAHKSDVGAVLLNVTNLKSGYSQLSAVSPTVLVEEMIDDSVAELIVGMAIDPVIGSHLIVGAGGILTELLADSTVLLLPFDETEAESALTNLKIARVLRGFRGRPTADSTSVVQALMAIQRRVLRGDVVELDVNPLMVTPDRAVAADVLLVLGGPI